MSVNSWSLIWTVTMSTSPEGAFRITVISFISESMIGYLHVH
jgi:hypothetical protein